MENNRFFIKRKDLKNIILTIILGLSLTGCDKEGQHAYTEDCPVFEVCDGKKYCNEFTAERNGIGPK